MPKIFPPKKQMSAKPVFHLLRPGTWRQFGKPESSCHDDHDHIDDHHEDVGNYDHGDPVGDGHDDHLGEVKVVLVDVDVDQLHQSVLQVSLVWPEQMMIEVPYYDNNGVMMALVQDG